jgi:imidazolonepropionase-like amidohydrolase
MDITILENCSIFDGWSEELNEGSAIIVEGGTFREVSRAVRGFSMARRIDCGGRFLMPGLIDCHFHAYLADTNVQDLEHWPSSLLAVHAAKILEGALVRGFTSVRDAAGGDIGLSIAIREGLINGPRFFFGGRALSQTGGHGDFRGPASDQVCSCSTPSRLIRRVDGEDAVRAAAREELRQGSHHVKIFVSGGITSPTDPLWMPQYSENEIRAAVEEARSRRTYVMAHCHTSDAARRCIDFGVRTLEHGTMLDAPTAKYIATRGAYVVPTLIIVDALEADAGTAEMSAESLEKLRIVHRAMFESLTNCVDAGVKLGFGTDLMGKLHGKQSMELLLRREVNSSIDVLRSATSVNAEILQMENKLGCIKPAALADLLVVDGNPLHDLGVLVDTKNIRLIMRDGAIVKNSL